MPSSRHPACRIPSSPRCSATSTPNIISMFKSGETRVPLAKVPALARALGLDAAILLREWFAAYEPEALPVIEMHFAGPSRPTCSPSTRLPGASA